MKNTLKLLASTFIATSAMMAGTNALASGNCEIFGDMFIRSKLSCSTPYQNAMPGKGFVSSFSLRATGSLNAYAMNSIVRGDGTIIYRQRMLTNKLGATQTFKFFNKDNRERAYQSRIEGYVNPIEGYGALQGVVTMRAL